ncbi:MAG: DUF445 domain-containing protein [Caldicoprobacterales bacterium]|nr:DUF445 family protein [Clostridiales bacterium]
MIELLIMTVVGALIGWFTNYLAVKMLFRPIRPRRVPLIKIELQGLIPRRREEIAVTIGATVEKELISVKDLVSRLIEGENRLELIRSIRARILAVIEERIPSFIPRGIKQAILSRVRDTVTQEIGNFVDNSMGDLIEQSVQKINISNMVEQRIKNLELEEVELLTLEIASKELKYIEYLGGVLGAVIGLIQGLLLLLLRNIS